MTVYFNSIQYHSSMLLMLKQIKLKIEGVIYPHKTAVIIEKQRCHSKIITNSFKLDLKIGDSEIEN